MKNSRFTEQSATVPRKFKSRVLTVLLVSSAEQVDGITALNYRSVRKRFHYKAIQRNHAQIERAYGNTLRPQNGMLVRIGNRGQMYPFKHWLGHRGE